MDFEEFRRKLIQGFPPQPFYGLVSTHDECDEGIALREALPGKRWDEVPPQFVDDNSCSLPLLAPRALVAFLPAWLLRAAGTFHSDSLVLEFFVYFLCPGSEDEGWDDESLAGRAGMFSAEQRDLIGGFLTSVSEDENLGLDPAYAEHALKWWHA
jgi:hypothetical protein